MTTAIFFNTNVPTILDGSKTQTVRRLTRCEIGEEIELFDATAKAEVGSKVGTAKCIDIVPIAVFEKEIILGPRGDHTFLKPSQKEEFAKKDGFDSEKDFRTFISQTYGLPFHGVIIKWGGFKPTKKGEEK